MARAAPDGYTIGFASQGTLVFNQGIYAKPGYDSTKDFAPIALLGGVSNVMIAELNKIFTSTETKEKLGPQGFDLSPPLMPAAFGKPIADDLVR